METVKVSDKVQLVLGFTPDQLRDALRDIFRHYGYDPVNIPDAAKLEVGAELSKIARRAEHGKEPWGRSYISNFLRGNVDPGQDFAAAIIGLAQVVDGANTLQVQTHPVQVQAVGNVRPGTVIWGDSQKCGRTGCNVYFIKRAWKQRFCTPECRRLDREEWRARRDADPKRRGPGRPKKNR